MSGPDAFTEPTLAELIQQRNKLNTEIDRLTAETENVPGAMTIVRDFVNWYGWYEREGFDDDSREELESIVAASRLLLSAGPLASTGDSHERS